VLHFTTPYNGFDAVTSPAKLLIISIYSQIRARHKERGCVFTEKYVKCRTMTRIILALSLFLSTAFVANVMSAVLPQEQFLQIYLLIQEGEKLESANQKASARSLFKVSEERLEKLNLNYPEWEPTIVKYRLRYSKDKLESLKDAVDADLNKPAPIIPPEITQGEVTDSITATAAGTRPSSPSEIMEAAAPTGMAPVIEVSGGDSSPTTEDPAALKLQPHDRGSRCTETAHPHLGTHPGRHGGKTDQSQHGSRRSPRQSRRTRKSPDRGPGRHQR